MTNAQISVIAEAAVAAVRAANVSISVPERVERAVSKAVWQAGAQFVHPTFPTYVESA